MPLLAPADASGHAQILLSLFIMLAAAKIFAEIFERLNQPAVVGEILAGVLVGPSLLGWVSPSEITATLAEIGVVLLLFTVGLETKPSAILKVGRSALTVAVLGIVVPFAGGWLIMKLWGGNNIQNLFMGTALVATSVGITARVLGAKGLLDRQTSRIILGAAVIDDILGLLVLAVVSSMAKGAVNPVQIGITASLSIGFTVAVVFLGAPLITRLAPRIENLKTGDSFFLFSLILCLGLSVVAAGIGVAAIIGAFLAGMALAEAAEDNHRLHRQIGGITEFMVPFFLVNIGMQLSLKAFGDTSVVVLALVLTTVAILTKLIGAGAGVIKMGLRSAAQVGTGMVPRGEVGIVVAQIGLSLQVIDDKLYAVVLFMAVVTTLVAPPFLTVLFKGEEGPVVDLPEDDGIVAETDSRLC